MAMHFDKEPVNPNISRTIRSALILHEWLEGIKEQEGIPFNHAVLQRVKNCMEEDRQYGPGTAGSRHP